MAKKEKPYRKLSGAANLAGYSNLFLAQDHLLLVHATNFNERYKRFFFKDIQAVILKKTVAGKVWNIIWACLASIFAVITIASETPFLWIIAGVFVAILIVNCLFGPTCSVHIKTAVQLEKLDALARMRKADKALAIIKDRVQEAQGLLSAEQMQLAHQEAQTPPAYVDPLPAYTPASIPSGLPLRPYDSKVHVILFILLLLLAVTNALQIVVNSLAVVTADLFLTAGTIAAAIVALLKQRQSDLRVGTQRLTWAAGIFVGVTLVIGWAETMVLSFKNPEASGNQWELIKAYAELVPLETPWLLAILLFNAVGAVALGGIGLWLLRDLRQPQATVVAPQEWPQPVVPTTPAVVHVGSTPMIQPQPVENPSEQAPTTTPPPPTS